MSDMKLLLLLCLLCLWVGSRSSHTFALEIRPYDLVTVSEGEDALLPCTLDSGQSIDKFDWRKENGDDEKKEVFFYDRGSHYNNGLHGQNKQFKKRVVFFQHELKTGKASIKIQNTRLEDNGTYTCVLFEPHRREVNIRLNVGAAPEPYIKPIRVEHTWWLLQCKVHGVPKPEVEWRNSIGEVLSVQDKNVQTSQDASGRFYVELTVNVTRSDNYTCVVTQRNIYHQSNNTMEAFVRSAAYEPFVTIINQTESGALLRCLIRGASPKPDVVWQDSFGNIIPAQTPQITERGGSYDIVLLTTVSRTDHYRCVVILNNIQRQFSAETYVMTYGALISYKRTGWIVLGVSLFLVIVAAIIAAFCYSDHRRRRQSGQASEHALCLNHTNVSEPLTSQSK